MEEMKILYLIRGVPGSGKSTLGYSLVCDSHVYAADDYFYVKQPDGSSKYCFDHTKLAQAHFDCQSKVEQDMQTSYPEIAVTNTFVKKKDMIPYYILAGKYGYEVIEIIIKSNFKNIHNVPDAIIEKMRRQFEY